MMTFNYDGLSMEEAVRRLAEHGPNRITPPRTVRFLAILLEEITEPMILLLLGVAAAYFLFGERTEAFVVLGIIFGILFVEVWTEYRAKRSVNALSRLTEPETLVLREGEARQIPVEQVVPGDLLFLQAGSRVPADARLLRADDLAADESTLTGESLPVEKCAVQASPDTLPAERREMVFRGTMITRGEGLAEVVATGRATQLGQIAGLAEQIRLPRTPLQQTMRELSRTLALVALGFAVLVPLISLWIGKLPWQEALLIGLSLAFATIPEELPILITVVLGLGSLRLAREHALVRELRAAETLGHVTAVVTDKTGTLTENRLRLSKWLPAGAREPQDVPQGDGAVPAPLSAAFKSLGLVPGNALPFTDPIERALWEVLAPGIEVGRIETTPVRIPFTRERGWSGAAWQIGDEPQSRRVFIKGAPEVILAHSDGIALPEGGHQAFGAIERAAAEEAVNQLAAKGYRVLAVAEADTDAGAGNPGRLPERWTFLGLIALEDPLRAEAEEAVKTVQRAGVRVYMATGDHPEVARSIARQVGIPAERLLTGPELDNLSGDDLKKALQSIFLFARIMPVHKLRLVQSLQELGQVVAMTGDGSNDAPALKAANVGVAMGRDGTDAAREASSLVLTDDRFATLATGIREGRGLFANLQKAVRYYLAVKVGLIAIMLLPALFGLASPFSPVMIILLELFMDLAASTAFVIEPPETDLMALMPRPPAEPFLDADMRRGILGGGALLAGTVLFGAWLGARFGGETSMAAYRASAFTAWMLGHVALAYRFRTWRASLREVGWLSNRILNFWALGATVTAMVVTYLPQVRRVMGTSSLPWMLWAFIGLVTILIIGGGGRLFQVRLDGGASTCTGRRN